MEKYNLSESASKTLDGFIENYRYLILSKAELNSRDGKISEEDISKACRLISRRSQVYDADIVRNTKRRRYLIWTMAFGLSYLIVGTLIYFYSQEFDIHNVSINSILILFGGLISILSVILYIINRINKKQLPDKRKSVLEFIMLWNNFEELLQEKFQGHKSKQHLSFIGLFNELLSENSNIQDSEQLIHILKLRNLIVHSNNLQHISICEIDNAIEALEQMIVILRNSEKTK